MQPGNLYPVSRISYPVSRILYLVSHIPYPASFNIYSFFKTTIMTNLENRISKLESQLRVYRMFFGVIIVGTCAAVLMSSGKKNAVPDLIQAKSFQVVDDNGSTIAILGKDKGNGSLTTFTPGGSKLVSLFTSEGGAGGINTFDNDGDVLFKVTRTTGGGAYLGLFNEDAKEIAEFGVTDGKSGYMRVNDKYGDKLAWITYTEGGGGYFALLNNNQETIRLSTPDQGGRLGMSNKRSKRVVFIGTQDNLDGNISIYNSNSETLGSIPK